MLRSLYCWFNHEHGKILEKRVTQLLGSELLNEHELSYKFQNKIDDIFISLSSHWRYVKIMIVQGKCSTQPLNCVHCTLVQISTQTPHAKYRNYATRESERVVHACRVCNNQWTVGSSSVTRGEASDLGDESFLCINRTLTAFFKESNCPRKHHHIDWFSLHS